MNTLLESLIAIDRRFYTRHSKMIFYEKTFPINLSGGNPMLKKALVSPLIHSTEIIIGQSEVK